MSLGSLVFIIFSACTTQALPLQSIDVRTGYFDGKLKSQGRYTGAPLLVSFNFDIKPLFEKIHIKVPGEINGCVEPFINTLITPDANAEIGSNFLMRYAYSITKRIKPYVSVGLGALFMTQHVQEQATQYNFLPQGGGGCMFFVQEKLALNLEYRYRHLSNSSIKRPNNGIDVNMWLAGFSYYY